MKNATNTFLSPLQDADAGQGAAGGECRWCHRAIAMTANNKRYCSQRCRQRAFKLRILVAEQARTSQPLKFAYADPPYPGLAKKFYQFEPSFAGEVDHAKLLASLEASYDGWALSTGAYALREVLPLCPAGVRVCAWVKPIGCSSKTQGLHNCWEPIIVKPGRRLTPGKRDWLCAQPARSGGELIGRKPIALCAFLYAALGLLPGDRLDDLFPGTGIVGNAWLYLSAQSQLLEERDHHGL